MGLPGSGGALGGGEEEGSEESSSIVAAGAQTVSLHQQEALQEGNSVKEFRQRHLLLPGDTAELREHCPQTWETDRWKIETGKEQRWVRNR